MTSMTQ